MIIVNRQYRGMWAIASMVFVDPDIRAKQPDTNRQIKGARQVVLFYGHSRRSVLRRIRKFALEQQEGLMAGMTAMEELHIDIGGPPYRCVVFLGLEDAQWCPELIQDGAMVYYGRQFSDLVADSSFTVDFQRWKSSSRWRPEISWCLGIVKLTTRDLSGTQLETTRTGLIVFRAGGAKHAVRKLEGLMARRIAVPRGASILAAHIVDIAKVIDPEMVDGTELFHYQKTHGVSEWQGLIPPIHTLLPTNGNAVD